MLGRQKNTGYHIGKDQVLFVRNYALGKWASRQVLKGNACVFKARACQPASLTSEQLGTHTRWFAR